MTEVYFVRHAEPNYNNHDDFSRELSEKGLRDRILVSNYLSGRGITAVLSSPYRRAVDTVKPFAEANGLQIDLIDGFRERRVDSGWIEDFDAFSRRQWSDFNYKLSDGESLQETQERNIRALRNVLTRYQGQCIAIGGHGTAISTVLRYYDSSFGYEQFQEIKHLMPWMVKLSFNGGELQGMEKINLFS